MVAAYTEPPPKRMRYRSWALAYIRRFRRLHRFSGFRAASRRSLSRSDTCRACSPLRAASRSFTGSGGARSPTRVLERRSFVDSSEAHPIQVSSKRSFVDSRGPRPVIRDGSRRGPNVSTRENSGIKLIARRSSISSGAASPTSAAVEASTLSDKSPNLARTPPRRSREDRTKRRHRLLALLYGHGGCHFRLFCGCCVDKDAFDPGEVSSFRWGVGFDDSYYGNSNNYRLSSGTRFRLGLCGFQVSSELHGDEIFVGDRSASFYNEFGSTCASPVACHLPLDLAPARSLATTLRLCSSSGKTSGKFTFSSGNSAVTHLPTGFKRKTPSSSSYPSYTPNTPPSPIMNDFRLMDSFTATRPRSRVSVGCNGWFLADDDPSIAGWYRHRSSGEVKPKAGDDAHLPLVTEASRDSEVDIVTPKQLKTSSHIHEPPTQLLASRLSPSSISSRSSSTPRLKPSDSAAPPDSRVSILLLPHDGSVSSTCGGDEGNASRLFASGPLQPSPASGLLYQSQFPPVHFATSRSPSLVDDVDLRWLEEIENETTGYDPPSKRRRSTSSSSNSSGGFGYNNLPLSSMADRQSFNGEDNQKPLIPATRFSANLRITKSLSPRTLKRTFFIWKKGSAKSQSQRYS